MDKLKDTEPLPFLTTVNKCICFDSEKQGLGISPCRSTDHWAYALSQVSRSGFNTTSAAVSAPGTFLLAYEDQLNQKRNMGSSNIKPSAHKFPSVLSAATGWKFNAEPLWVEDIFDYRRQRSENLLIRMMHYFPKDEFNQTIVRLSRGIFMTQQIEDPRSSSSTTNSIVEGNATMPTSFVSQEEMLSMIDTFSFNDLFNDMMQQIATNPAEATITATEKTPSTYKPITYTIGIRFSNPYNHMRDIVVRGNIPLWCQTLFITECLRRLPIHPNSWLAGLLPFAKDISFEFRLISSYTYQDVPYPELIPIYERFAMELSEPQIVLVDYSASEDGKEYRWKDREQKILGEVLFCDILDETAVLITNLANEWAKAQNISM